MRRVAAHLGRLLRLTDNASIAKKLLIAPILAVLALALVFGTSLYGFRAEAIGDAKIEALQTAWLTPMTETRFIASDLQANMFRITAFGLMGVERRRLDVVAEDIRREDAALSELMRDPPDRLSAPAMRAALLDAYGEYRRVSTNAVANFLKNPGWGATTARNAAAALDSVIARANDLRAIAMQRRHAYFTSDRQLQQQIDHELTVVMTLGSIGVVLANLFVGWRISAPLRALTAAMARLADRHYDQAIPATGQRDEVGSMARAVEVFKGGMIRADAITAEHQATRNFLHAIVESLPVAVIIKSVADLRYVIVNSACERLLALSSDDLIGKTVFDLVSEEEANAITAKERAAANADGITVYEDAIFNVRVASGATRQLVTVITHSVVTGPDSQPHLISVIQDITDRRNGERRMAHMAQFDSLTDLPNRTLFAERLAEALRIAQRGDSQIAVLGLDLDRFKEVNDTLGHAAGDMLLRIATGRLSCLLRTGDTLARLGGDEFAVIQNRLTAPADAEALACRLIATMREPFDLDGQRVFIGLSIGISISDGAVSPTELVQQADLALYEAKQSGRGGYRFFLPKLSARMHQRRTMEQDLRVALDNGQLCLHYQPSVALPTGAIAGTEALMRWTHPTMGAVPPTVFIPVAEETGLIGPLGLWLLDEACREAASWVLPIRVAINVSPVQFRTPGFVGHVQQALARTGLAPARLELEITEGVLMRDTAETLATLAALREIGTRIVLDDFGTGYASLAYLQTFTFDKIKIDRSFVKNMETDPTALAIMRAVLGLTQSLNMTTTAEGIEEETQADLLRILGCNEAQGYLFWRPMPAAALRALLKQRMQPNLALAGERETALF